MPTITEAVHNDLPAILSLQKLCYRENALRYKNENIHPLMQTVEDVEKEFIRCVFLKAMAGPIIIGSIRARQTGDTCFIVRLFVHPGHQNRGVGKNLMAAIEARFAHVNRYELFTGYKDEKNIRLYTSLGYSRFREERRDDGMIFYFLEKTNPA
jgi:GNAT superfamily N-acetyltransferase